MYAISADEMRKKENELFASHKADSYTLMQAAGKELAKTAEEYGGGKNGYAVFAGKGNNAGDGFVAASELAKTGARVRVYMIYPHEELQGSAARAFAELDGRVQVQIGLPDNLRACDGICALDCLLGTGYHGTLRAPYAEWIGYINQLRGAVVSADIPSGVNGNDGSVEDMAVHANTTVTFGTAKTGLLLNDGPRYSGQIRVADIGFPNETFTKKPEAGIVYTSMQEVQEQLGPLPRDTYKHRRGHVLIAGGSIKYPFAPLLSGEAALRGTAGLVTVLLPHGVPVSGNCPHALMISQEREGDGYFTGRSIETVQEYHTNAIAVGMGLGLSKDATEFVRALLSQEYRGAVLLDADGLSILGKDAGCQAAVVGKREYMLVVTPHEGEMRRLESGFRLDSSQGRIERACNLAMTMQAHVVFKGMHTVVAAPDGRYSININGSPVLATAGSGDVLAGILVSMLASGMECHEACKCGVFLHGLCGELAQGSALPMPGIIADDLVAVIPEAYRKLVTTRLC